MSNEGNLTVKRGLSDLHTQNCKERKWERSPTWKAISSLVQSLHKCLGFGNQGPEWVTSLKYHFKLPPPLGSLHPPRPPSVILHNKLNKSKLFIKRYSKGTDTEVHTKIQIYIYLHIYTVLLFHVHCI